MSNTVFTAVQLETEIAELYDAYIKLVKINPETDPVLLVSNLSNLLKKTIVGEDTIILKKVRDLYGAYKTISDINKNTDPSLLIQNLEKLLTTTKVKMETTSSEFKATAVVVKEENEKKKKEVYYESDDDDNDEDYIMSSSRGNAKKKETGEKGKKRTSTRNFRGSTAPKGSLGKLLKRRKTAFEKAAVKNSDEITTPSSKPDNNIVKYWNPPSPSSDSSLVEVDERKNFGFSDDGPLANCSLAKDFWWADINSKKTKYFIRLHSNGENPQGSQLLAVTERVGLDDPQTLHIPLCQLKYYLLEQDETRSSKLIWLDLRDLDYFLSPLFWDFISEFNSSITHLSMSGKLTQGTNTIVCEKVFMEFLYQRVHYIEYLCVNDEQIFPGPGDFTPSGIRPLTTLKTLRFINTSFNLTEIFIDHILQKEITPNLKAIYNLPLKYLTIIKKVGRFGDIKSIDFSTSLYNQSLKDFSQDLIQLTLLNSSLRGLEELKAPVYLRIHDKVNRGKNIDFDNLVKEMFEAHQKTLRKLTIEPVPRYFTHNIPLMRKIDTLEFDLWLSPIGYHPIYADGTDMSEIFPSVSKVILNFSQGWENVEALKGIKKDELNHFRSSFPVDWNSFKKVQSLELKNFIPGTCLQEAAVLFKNIKSLSLKSSLSKICQVLPKCLTAWSMTMSMLQELKLEIQLSQDDNAAELNSSVYQVMNREGGGNGTSLFKMTELKDLKIIFSGCGWSNTNLCGNIYLPNLKRTKEEMLSADCQVEIGFDESCTLDDKGYIVSLLQMTQIDGVFVGY